MTAPHDVVGTERTLLVLIPKAFMDAIREERRRDAARILGASIPEDWPDEDDRWLLEVRQKQLQDEPASATWLVRAIVTRSDRRMIGHIGFHGAPDERGVVEVGYTVFGEHRRRGYAEEAIRALFEWAHATHGIRRFRASVSPDNEPSLALTRKLGFVQVGVQWDERDGQELVFETSYPLAPATQG